VSPTAAQRGVPRRYLRSADFALAASLGGLLLWSVVTGWLHDHGFSASLVHGRAVVFLGTGVVAGRLCARRGLWTFASATAAVLVVGLLVVDPFYPNAEAAAGIQLVALAGLLLTAIVHEPSRARIGSGRVTLAAGVGVLGVLLAAGSQASSVLVVLVVVLIAAALRRRVAASRFVHLRLGLASIAAAVLAVFTLGALPVWPGWLSHEGSLSGARHRLWGDALALWREHPLIGGGPGSFYEYSETARSEDHLYAAHSSILQVAAELGSVGVLLFLAVLISGALIASQGDPARGLIGVTAWCALAVHSMIDHLYEFPLVVLLAGVVIGGAGARREQADGDARAVGSAE
jgi:O-antigen ligase